MKKIFYPLLSLLLASGSTAIAQSAEILTFDRFDDSCVGMTEGESLWVSLYGNVSGATAGMYVDIYFGDGTSATSEIFSSGYFNTYHPYETPGTYTVVAELKDELGDIIDTYTMTRDLYCKYITLKEYMRNDANCEYNDDTEVTINTGNVYELRKDGILLETHTLHGNKIITIHEPAFGVEYTIQQISTIDGLENICSGGVPYSHTFILDTLDNNNNAHYVGFDCSGTVTEYDFAAHMTGYMRYIENSHLTIHANNLTCNTEDATITLEISPKYNYVSSYGFPPSSIVGNTLTWNVSSMSIASGNIINSILLNPATTLTAGDTATHVLSITPTTGDLNASNNIFIFNDTIRSAYDPNNKLVSPADILEPNQKMTYTINFENLGNDTAFNIYIMDMMDNNLDLSTFSLIASSHNCHYNIINKPSGENLLKIEFPRILLPDASSPEYNKGFVIYEVNAKSELSAGDEVRNTAEIFFDINPAIVTNTTINTVPSPASMEEIQLHDGINVSPNPSNGLINIENSTIKNQDIKIVNSLGQILKDITLKPGINKINLENVASGLYYIILTDQNLMKSSKFVIQK